MSNAHETTHAHTRGETVVLEDVALVGMACLFPGAPDLATFWQNVVAGFDALTDPPPEHWDLARLYDPDGTRGTEIYSKRGGYLGDLARFDPLVHGIMPRALEGSEPDHWLALHLARQAFADAGYAADIPERHRTAVVLGKGNYVGHGTLNVLHHGTFIEQMLDVLRRLQPAYGPDDLQAVGEALRRSLPPFDADTVPGLVPNIVAGRIANRFDLMGPNYTIDGACASSLLAVDTAVNDLRAGRCDLALAGGIHLVAPVPARQLFCKLGALSRTEQIRPFDASADGTLISEGMGMVVLKRLADAERDGNRIYAVVKAVGASSDGRGFSVMAPRSEGQVLAMRRAYAQAGINPRSVDLIEAHGTGTLVGDRTEVQSMAEVFGTAGDDGYRCAVGSVKSMLGHLLPASGIAGLIKTALAVYHRVLPPTIHVDTPALALDGTPFDLNTETRSWIRDPGRGPRRAGVNAFGFGGINAHVLLEEYTAAEEETLPTLHTRWDTEVLALSGATRGELMERIEALRGFLQSASAASVRLVDLAYTLSRSLDRPSHAGDVRLAVVAASLDDLEEKLGRALKKLADPACRRIKDRRGLYFTEEPLGRTGKLAFLFPGEGSQHVGMLADLCLHFSDVRRAMEWIDLGFRHAGQTPSRLLYPPPLASADERRAAHEWLWTLEGALASVLTGNAAVLTLVERLCLSPDAVVGHSMGEITATMATGMIDTPDPAVLHETGARLRRVARATVGSGDGAPSALVAAGADAATVTDLISDIDGDLSVAIDNCPHQCVLVGPPAAVDEAVGRMHTRGILTERLPFDRPYHTPRYRREAALLSEALGRPVRPPQTPLYSCVTAAPFPDDLTACRKLLDEQWTRPIRFRETIERMYADGFRVFVEVGARSNLTVFVDDILRGRPYLAVPVDRPGRTGTEQLNHLVGLLAVHGVSIDPDVLYARRTPRLVAFDAAAGSDAGRRPSERPLNTAWPAPRLSADTGEFPRPGPGAGDGLGAPSAFPAPPAPGVAAFAGSTLPLHPTPPPMSTPGADTRPGADAASRVVSAHMQTMAAFLSVQQELMQAYLRGRAPTTTGSETAAPDLPADAALQPRSLAAPPVEAAPPPETPGPETPVEALKTQLLSIVSERTGYPVDLLDPTLDLEADLGIDSIKRVEILGAFQRASGAFVQEDMERLASLRSLGDILAFLQTGRAEAGVSDPQAMPAPPEPAYAPAASLPFVQEIDAYRAGERAVGRCRLTLDEHVFLHDHTFGRDLSAYDPTVIGIPVMPLAMTMEMMAEAASVLYPDLTVVGLRDVHASRWIAPSEAGTTVQLEAEALPPTDGIVDVAVRVTEPDDGRPVVLAEAVVRLADAYPAAPEAAPFALAEPRPAPWAPERYYEDIMFHGPAFRGVAVIQALGTDGAEAELAVLPRSGLLRANVAPALRLDPLMLDQLGQVIGFWATDRLEHNDYFPFRIGEITCYGPPLPPGERLGCRVRILETAPMYVRADVEVVDAAGRVWLRCLNRTDHRTRSPKRLVAYSAAIASTLLADPVDVPAGAAGAGLTAVVLRSGLFAEGTIEQPDGMGQRLLATLVGNHAERATWAALDPSPDVRVPWLLGRIAAKDAVREALRRQSGWMPRPADIELPALAGGAAQAGGPWTGRVGEAPVVAVARGDGVYVAVARAEGGAAADGTTDEQLIRTARLLAGAAFS